MSSLCLYFKVHQPFQLKPYYSGDIEVCHSYEDACSDKAVMDRLATNCYLPANALLLWLIRETGGLFRLSFSMSGTVLELLQRYRPDVIDSFRQLTDTGCVEILAETYYHSFSCLHSRDEFQRQIRKHGLLVRELFGQETAVFRNTELIYNNGLAVQLAGMGYKGILCEGIEALLQGRSPNSIYYSPGVEKVKLLLRNSGLSDDIAFRFDNPYWSEYPLTAEKFAEWIHRHPADTEVINLFIDYETFGIHKSKETGIFEFLRTLPAQVLSDPRFRFRLPSDILQESTPGDVYDVKDTISWEGQSGMDIVWGRNVMQNNTLKKIYSLEKMVMASESDASIDTWGKLQAADYLYYMLEGRSTLNSPAEAFRYYTNIVIDFEIGLIRKALKARKEGLNYN